MAEDFEFGGIVAQFDVLVDGIEFVDEENEIVIAKLVKIGVLIEVVAIQDYWLILKA